MPLALSAALQCRPWLGASRSHSARSQSTACHVCCTGPNAWLQDGVTPRQQLRQALPRRRRSAAAAAAASGGGDLHQPPPEDDPPAVPDAVPLAAGSDWRAFRAQLVASSKAAEGGAPPDAPPGSLAADAPWAHSLPSPEQGCLLLANPLMFATSQQYFHMAAILVFAHDGKGSAGLILNRPTEFTVGQLGAGAASLQPELDDCRLFLGGDVGADSVHILHGVPGVAGAAEILPGVYLGGFQAVKAGLGEGAYRPGQFKVLTRYAGWGPGQLEAEVKRGVWLCVSANKHAILSNPLEGSLLVDMTQAEERVVRGRHEAAAMWHYLAQLAGGDLAALSREVQGVPDPDISRAAGGGLQQDEAEEADGTAAPGTGGLGSGGDPSQAHHAQQARWQQQRRRTRLADSDYRDGAGI